MKKKLLALALSCATLSMAIMPTALAVDPAPATINVTGGSTSMTANGAFSSGVYFNIAAGSTSTVSAAADSSGTALDIETDYLAITSSDTTDEWGFTITGAAFTDTNSNSYGLGSSATSTTLVVSAVDTDQNSVSQAATVASATAAGTSTCAVAGTDVTFVSTSVTPLDLTTSAQTLVGFDTGNTTNCVSYTMHVLPVIDLEPINTGFANTDDPTSSITFTLL